MPDPRAEATTRIADAEDAVVVPTPQHRPLGLSLTQIAGGALAAVTAAVAASFLGVAGTLTGAALGSVVSSIGAAVYSTSINRAARASRVLVVRPGGLAAADPADVPPPVGHHPEVLADAPAGAVTTPADTQPSADPSGWSAVLSRLRWRPVLLVAGTFFVAAMAVIVVTELVIGHPISDSSKPGTTISNIGGSSGSSGPSSPSPAPTTGTSSTSGSPSPGASPTGTPSPGGSPAPSPASVTGTAPAGTSTTTAPEATTGAPAPTTPATTAPAPAPSAS